MLLALAGTAAAQDKRLSITLEPLIPTCRTAGPLPVEWRCSWSGTGIREGQIVFDVLDGNRVTSHFVSGTVVLSNGEQRFRQLLPPMEVLDQYERADLRIRFITKDQTFQIGEQSVRIPRRQQSVFAIGICDAWDVSQVAPAATLEEHLELEQFDPQRKKEDRPFSARPIVTVSSRILPRNLPSDPLSYTGFDMLVIAGEGLGALREPQLQALRQWVEAGGSLAISPTKVLKPHQVAFLNGLAEGSQPNAAPYSLDENGRLVETLPPGVSGLRPLRTGLGRTLIIPADTTPDFESNAWIDSVKFLWKFRKMPSISMTAPTKLSGQTDWNEHVQALPPLGYPLLDTSWLVRFLMPQTVRTLPLGLMAGILGIYIICVGPLDYYFLGRLRMRKWTWLLFPVLTIAFASFIVGLSNRSLQRGNVRESVVIVDLVNGNKVARVNRFEMMFLGVGQTVQTTANRAMFVPLTVQQSDVPMDVQYQTGSVREKARSPHQSDPIYNGWIPGQCTVSQTVPQWTPQLNRLMQIAPSATDYPPGFDWDSITVSDLQNAPARKALEERMRATFGPQSAMYVKSSAGDIGPQAAPTYMQFGGAYRATPSMLLEPNTRQALYKVVSQVSPAGGANPIDLPLMDESDPNLWLLSVTVPRDGEIWIYRRMYRGAE